MSTATKHSVPVDQRGNPIYNAMGLPLKLDNFYLGSATQWAILFDLTTAAYQARVFSGISVRNPSGSSDILLAAAEDADDTPIEFLTVGVTQYFTLDRLMYGPLTRDESSGKRSLYILGKLSLAQGTQASATIDYSVSGQPADQDTVNVNGVIYEFSDDASHNPSNNFRVAIGGSADITWQNFVNVVNLTQRYVFATINTVGDIVTLTANPGGTSGNSITIADGGTGATFSGATLAGGVGGVLGTYHIW